MSAQQIHQGQRTLTYGIKLDEAKAAVILLHGRGATAESMLDLAAAFPSEGIAYLLPQAANNLWYPNSGFAPLEANEPYLSSAMETIRGLIQQVNDAGIPTDKIALGGFSQGAVLAAEFAAQNAQRYGGLLIFSGALMGPLDMPRSYQGTFDGTPVFIGGIDHDPWVSEEQLRHAAQAFTDLGANVTIEVLPGSQHTIRPSEIERATTIINQLT